MKATALILAIILTATQPDTKPGGGRRDPPSPPPETSHAQAQEEKTPQ